MIDGFIMRDPGSYDDIMDILVDEKVVTEKEGDELKIDRLPQNVGSTVSAR